MDQQVNVPIDKPNADTEWNDILRKHGIIPEKPPDPEPAIQEAIEEAERRAHENRLEDKTLDQLDELEDDEDEFFLASYRQKRLTELSNLAKASVHGQVYPLQKAEYAREVTEASEKYFVFVLLVSSQADNVESQLLSDYWRQLAQKYGDVKFCQMRAVLCIENYPERNTPTILIYKDGNVVQQVVTLKEYGSTNTQFSSVEKLLVQVGAIASTDMRLGDRNITSQANIEDKGGESDDDDWD